MTINQMVNQYCKETDSVLSPREVFDTSAIIPILEDEKTIGFFGIVFWIGDNYAKPIAVVNQIYILKEFRDNRGIKIFKHFTALLENLENMGVGQVEMRLNPTLAKFGFRKGLKPRNMDFIYPIETWREIFPVGVEPRKKRGKVG